MVVVIKVPCISVWVYECLFFCMEKKDFYIEEKLLRLLLLHHSGHPVSSVQFTYDGTENETCNEHPWAHRGFLYGCHRSDPFSIRHKGFPLCCIIIVLYPISNSSFKLK